MESFLTTLPPYVHQYINKYPPTDCFNVLKELICFAVLYSNDRERTNLLSLDLLHKQADQAVVHQPYTCSTLTSPSTPDAQQVISEADTIPKQDTAEQQDGTSTQKSTVPYLFPDWWAHPDSDDATSKTSPSPEQRRLTRTPERLMTQEMNITQWIPVDFDEKPAQTTSRPSSVYHPTIPDLRSYLKTNKSAKNPPPKVSRRTSVPTTMCDSPTTTVTPTKPVPRQTPPLTPSLSTTLSRSSSTSTIYRPGQTATVRARAEQAKQRQRQLEEEKKKQAAKSMASRTSLRLKQHATSGIDWDTIKQDRRKTLPGQSS